MHKGDAQKNYFYEKTVTNWIDQIAATEDNFDKELEWRTCWENEQPLLMDVFAFLTASTVSCFLVTTLDVYQSCQKIQFFHLISNIYE